jgi:hypothetical protein
MDALYTLYLCQVEGLRVKFWDSSLHYAKYNDDISLLILQCLISGTVQTLAVQNRITCLKRHDIIDVSRTHI